MTDLKDRSVAEHNFERVNFMSIIYLVVLVVSGLAQVSLRVCVYCVFAEYVFACAQAISCTKYTFIHINKLRSYVGIFLILILYLGVAAAKPVRREIQDQPAVEEGIQRLVKINNITGDTRPFISDSSPQLF